MIRRPPRSTRVRSSAASDVYKRQIIHRPAGMNERLPLRLLMNQPVDPLMEGLEQIPIGLHRNERSALGSKIRPRQKHRLHAIPQHPNERLQVLEGDLALFL